MGKIKFNRELTDTVDHLFRMGNQDPSLEQIIREHTGVDSFQNMDNIREEYQGALNSIQAHLEEKWPTVHPVTEQWYASREENGPWRTRDLSSLNKWQLRSSVAGVAPVMNAAYGLRRATTSDDPLLRTFILKRIDQTAGAVAEVEARLQDSFERGLLTKETIGKLADVAGDKLGDGQADLFDESRKQLESA